MQPNPYSVGTYHYYAVDSALQPYRDTQGRIVVYSSYTKAMIAFSIVGGLQVVSMGRAKWAAMQKHEDYVLDP